MKTCSTCGIEMSLANFYSNGYDYKGKKKYKPRCKSCENKKRKDYHLERIIRLYGDFKCKICGYDKCIEALEFHHIDAKEKENNISALKSASDDILKKELEKGVYLCANCHRETHYGLHPEYLK